MSDDPPRGLFSCVLGIEHPDPDPDLDMNTDNGMMTMMTMMMMDDCGFVDQEEFDIIFLCSNTLQYKVR